MKRAKRAVRVFVSLLSVIFLSVACAKNPPKKTQLETESVSPSVSETNSSMPSPSTSETSTPSPSASEEEPVNTAKMYTSYAYMVSYDSTLGWADFDYFDMLTGDAAVSWLVEEEGYTQADAQEEVDNYADSEFICKNTNSQLRTVDLKDVSLRLMYNPDGTMVEGADPIDATVNDLNTLYELDYRLVLESFFYRVIVKNEEVVEVEQVYWP